MSKITIDDVIAVLNQQKLPDTQLHAIVKELNAIANEAKEDSDDKVPKAKNKFVVVLRSDDETLQSKLTQGAFIIQVPDADDTTTLQSRIATAARNHNDHAKRAKTKVTTLGDICLRLKRPYSKEQNFQVKTKLPVEVQVVTKEKIV